MEPITREEFYLNKLTGEDQTTPEPVTREEQYLSRLCGADNIIPQKPETRREAYLAALCGEEVETPEPVTRIEQYMNFAAGKSQSKPEKAITREEMYWDKYQGGAVPKEKTVQGDIIHITDATGDNAVALSVALTPTQDGTPWISDTLNTEPYLSRAAQNGNKADETIVGGTVAWNQLVDTGTTSVTVPTSHKYIAKINGIWTSRNGGTVSVTGGTDMLTDLTQMFGSTIADYVYSLETATTGAGVAWLRSHGFIDDVYHAYNPGELISAKPTAKTVGATTYALGGADLRGLFKLDANNNLYCDGDVYTADGTITRNYGIVDLGTLTWSYNSVQHFWYTALSAALSNTTNLLCQGLTMMSSSMSWVNMEDDTYGFVNQSFRVKKREITVTADFVAYIQGKYLVYELETPTTEASTAYTNPQKAGEAEAFVDARTEKVPVGHSTRYSAEYAINGFEGVTVHVSETQTGGTTYPVTFTSQGTVYGGTIDVVSGEMSITYAIEDLGNLEWEYRLSPALGGYVFTAPFTSDYTATSYVTAYAKANNPPAMPYGTYHLEYSGLYIRDPRTTDTTEFTRLVTGQKIVYKLAEPITATIDPTEISLNEGENYVWTEEGTTTLTYMARAAQRVLAMNRTLQKNLNAIELKKGGDVK